MGNPASRLGCLGGRRNRSRFSPRIHTNPRTQGDLSPRSEAPHGLLPPGVPWAWWGSCAVQVTEVTETVVTETVVTEAVEMGPCKPRGQPVQAPLAALDTLRSWLDGMGELQATQGPLAADATLAASQLREQELLLRLLKERAPHVEPKLREAGNPSELCTQWHRLVQKAETRWRLLEQLVPAAQSFETACKALVVQLSSSEQLLAELRLGPKGLEESLPYLQEVCEGVVARARDLERVLQTGQRLAELLTSDQARLVRQQLNQFQERVKLTESQAACAWQKLLFAQRTESSKPLPPAGPEAQLELEGSASTPPELEDLKQLTVQLVQLAERLEQLAQWAETSSQAAAPAVTIWEQSLSSATPQADTKPLEGHWLETREQDVWPKAIWEPAVQISCGLADQAAVEKLRPERDWNPGLQEFLWGQQTLAVSWLGRRGAADHGSTCHLGLLMDLQGCQAAMSSPSCKRIHTLEGVLLLVGHLVEKLVLCPHRLSQAESLRIKVVQAQNWVLEEMPPALTPKYWTQAPREILTLRSLDQGPPGDLTSRAKACLLGKIRGELSWRPWWSEVMENWSLRKPEHSKRNQDKRDQWRQLEQGHQGQAVRGAMMVRVGGGWAALDEFLVKNDPVRAKGRTSQKIHERFLCWTPSVPAPEVITLRLWTSIRMGTSRPLSQKTGLPIVKDHRDPSSYKVKTSEQPTEEKL